MRLLTLIAKISIIGKLLLHIVLLLIGWLLLMLIYIINHESLIITYLLILSINKLTLFLLKPLNLRIKILWLIIHYITLLDAITLLNIC